MSSKPSKGNQIHPSAIQNKDIENEPGESGEKKRRISLLNPQLQGAKEIHANLSENAKLEKDFNECFSTPEQRNTFFRSTKFMEKHLVAFANKSTKVSQETLHFAREFVRGVRLNLEDATVTAKEEQDLDENDFEKTKVKEEAKEKRTVGKFASGRSHSIVEQLAQRETAEIKFTFKRVITTNHEPYEVLTKNTIGKWLIGEKWAKRLLNMTKGLYAIPWFFAMVASFVLFILFVLKGIPDTHNLLLIVPFLFFTSYSVIMMSAINIVLFKKLLLEFMFWYTFLSCIIGLVVASVALDGTQRLVCISAMPAAVAFIFSDAMPRVFLTSMWVGEVLVLCASFTLIVAIQQSSHDKKLDFQLPLFGTYSWTGVAITALSNYIVMMTKLFVVSLWDSKRFVILKVPLQNTKMMENRAEMILVTAEKEKLYKKVGEDGQKLMTAIVGSTSETVPWKFFAKTSKSISYSRSRIDEKHQVTADTEFKLKMFTKRSLEKSFTESLHNVEGYEVLHLERNNRRKNRLTNMSGDTTSRSMRLTGTSMQRSQNRNAPNLPNYRVLYRRIKVPYPGVSDRLLCIETRYRYFPEHGFAFQVTRDADQKWLDQVPQKVKEGTVRSSVRLAGYVLEKMNSRVPMTKVTYFVSAHIGGWIPVSIRNFLVQGETSLVEKAWDEYEYNDGEPALYRTDQAISNFLNKSDSRHLLGGKVGTNHT